jgi:hypothetical protein
MTTAGTDAPTPVVEVAPLDPDRRADVEGVAALHAERLPTSPVVLLGPEFVRRFYYGTLVRAGLVAVHHARADGRVVGFISYTREPLGFMTKGVRQHFFALAWSLVIGVLRDPSVVKQIVFALRLMRETAQDERVSGVRSGAGEVLSLAVAERYERAVPVGGTSRLPVRLVAEMARSFAGAGVEDVNLYVLPGNLASNLFCSSLGCDFERITRAGTAVHCYVFHPPAWLASTGG